MPTEATQLVRNQGLGNGQAITTQNPPNIVANRAPTTLDRAELGTLWVNPLTNIAYILTSISGGVSTWSSSPAGGATVLASLQITGGAGDVLTVDAGDVLISSGNLSLAAGDLSIVGNLAVTGNSTFTGDVDITDTSSITLTSTNNAAKAIYLHANGGTSETIEIESTQGTGVAAIKLLATAGGITLQAGGNPLVLSGLNQAVNIISGTGAINVGADAVAHTVTIGNITGATAVAINSGTGSITLTSTGTGDILLDSDDTLLVDADGVLELNSSAGAISIGNDADAQAINVGTAGVRPISIGNSSAGTTLLLSAPANVGVNLMSLVRIMAGAGSPNGAVTAPAGSLWLRTDPAGATSRAYINTDSGTTWTNFTMAA